MSNKTSLPPEIQKELDSLRQFKKKIIKCVDLNFYPADEIMHHFSSAIISLIKDDSFRKNPAKKEVADMLHVFHDDLFNLLREIEKH